MLLPLLAHTADFLWRKVCKPKTYVKIYILSPKLVTISISHPVVTEGCSHVTSYQTLKLQLLNVIKILFIVSITIKIYLHIITNDPGWPS
jgi:hypothetical protein